MTGAASLNYRARIWALRFSNLSDNQKRHAMANYSTYLDKFGFNDAALYAQVFKVFRLAHKLGIRGMNTNMAQFAADFEKFEARPPSANYDLSGRPFSSLDDGTIKMMWMPSVGLILTPADPRVAKVKRFLRRHLTREPTDKDVDWFVYTYFGSDAFYEEFTDSLADLFYGMQDSYYNARGRRKQRNDANFEPPIRRNQRRIRSGVGYNRSTYSYHGEANSNSNSNSNNRHPTAVAYRRNKSAVKRNQNRNKSNTAKRIQWKEDTVNNMPEDHIAGHNFSNGQKAVKYTYGPVSQYLLPQSFRNQARMSMTDAYNKPASFSIMQNPFTRGNVKRANISFVILKNKNQGRATKLKIQAAKKIQTARRKQVRRTLKRKRRSPSK